MGIEFDWQITEEGGDESQQKHWSTPPWMRWGALLLIALVCAGVLGGFWWRVDSAESELRNSIQTVIDLQQQALQQQDGELFLSTFHPEEPAFQLQQLLPDIQASYALNQTVTNAERRGDIIWTNISQSDGTTTQQQIAFFEESDNGTLRIASDPAYWGALLDTQHSWGTLRAFDADKQWSEQLSQTIEQAITSHTFIEGLRTLPETFTVYIRNDYDVSIKADTVYFPSPRLVGLNANGEPSASYLNSLRSEVLARLEPVTIRFALPDYSAVNGVTTMLEQYAIEFADQYDPGQIHVDILSADQLGSADVEAWLPHVDGAFLQPTEAMIKAGYLYDLTQMVSDDSGFDRGDYYVQAWQGSWWRDRMWMVPWTTSLNLIYYDQSLFTDDQPQVDWTWEDVQERLQRLTLSDADARPMIDPTRDLLYAYAFSNAPACLGQNCMTPLSPSQAVGSLDWYRSLVNEQELLTDLGTLGVVERREKIWGTLSANKQVAMWIDSPLNYEYQIGLQRTNVLPFLPFSAETPLTMPVHINGHVISSHSDHPYWTWQWLKFLSYKAAPARLRHIPARPSVTRQTQFWQKLPEPISDAYQVVFADARPILIGEENYFTWSQLDHVLRGNSVNTQIAQPDKTNWFLEP